MKGALFLMLGLGLMPTAPSIATIIRVPADQATIQMGINLAFDGDTVLVAPGTYVENLFISGKGIYLLSEKGADSTTVTPATTTENIIKLYNISGKSNTIRGFRFTGVQGMHCVASYNGASVTVEECDFVDNVIGDTDGYLDAGALFVRGTGIIRNNRFINNRGGSHGGGIRIVETGNSIIEYNEFRYNSAIWGGGINLLWSDNVVVRYNLFVSDSSQLHGGAIYLGNSNNIRMFNNTIDSCVSLDNTGGGISFIYCWNDTSLNNIVSNCGGYGIWQFGSSGYRTDYDDCWSNFPDNYYGITPGPGSLSADPHFVGGTPFDYNLHGSSPCINTWHPDPIYNDADGTRNDIGAYTLYGAGCPLPTNLGFGSGYTNGYVVVPLPTVYWRYLDTAVTTQTQFEIEVGTDEDWSVAEMWQSGIVTSSDTAAVYAGTPLANHGFYFLRIRVANSLGWGGWSHIVMRMRIGKTIRVPADQATIQAGINEAMDGDTILVASGSYAENLFISDKGIYLLSEKGADSTTVTPAMTTENIIKLHNISGKSNTIRGFRFTGVEGMHCVASYDGATVIVEECDFVDNVIGDTDGYLDAGALFVRGTGIIRNNRFINNRGGSHGGGIRIVETGNSIIEYNEFRYNSAIWGGGINLLYAANVVVRYNLFVADSAQGHGGAIYLGNANNIRMINNTIDSCVSLDNTGGGISFIYCWNDTSLNNIVSNSSGYGIWQFGSSDYQADYDNCWSNLPADYYGIAPSAGSISADPHFVGGTPFSYNLQGMSPCIDAGDPDSIYNDSDGSRNDMGRYPLAMIVGDANGDGTTNITDVVFLINYIFIGGAAPQPLLAGDSNCDGRINIADVVHLIRYIFSGGSAPCAILQ